jgi:hypothetical protein
VLFLVPGGLLLPHDGKQGIQVSGRGGGGIGNWILVGHWWGRKTATGYISKIWGLGCDWNFCRRGPTWKEIRQDKSEGSDKNFPDSST